MRFIFDDPDEENYWISIFNTLFLEGKPDTWDYVWTFACWSQGGLTALPSVNLVSNIGFRSDGTHTVGDSRLANMITQDIGEIHHPPFVARHKDADTYTFKYVVFNNTSRLTAFLKSLYQKAKKFWLLRRFYGEKVN